jgi:hypothetical protein
LIAVRPASGLAVSGQVQQWNGTGQPVHAGTRPRPLILLGIFLAGRDDTGSLVQVPREFPGRTVRG